MTSFSYFEEAFTLLNHAIQLEDDGYRVEAHQKYQDAISVMQVLVQHKGRNNRDAECCATKHLLLDKIKHYQDHARNLLPTEQQTIKISSSKECKTATDTAVALTPSNQKPQSKRDLMSNNNKVRWEETVTEQAAKSNAYLSVALNLDESGQKGAAIDKYLSAAEALLSALTFIGQAEGEVEARDERSYMSTRSGALTRRLQNIMDRVGQLKRICKSREQSDSIPSFTIDHAEDRQTSPSTKLTTEEIAVLKRSSLIASGLFMPWIDNEVRTFDFTNGGKVWSDPEGMLKLSSSQNEKLYAWKRPSEIIAMRSNDDIRQVEPVMVKTITPYTIRQRAVTDCSFIARCVPSMVFVNQYLFLLLSAITSCSYSVPRTLLKLTASASALRTRGDSVDCLLLP